MEVSEFCHEFHKVDLRLLENCLKVTANATHGTLKFRYAALLKIKLTFWILFYQFTIWQRIWVEWDS